ncbi:MAG TPA: glycosyltransferase family 2 protein [Anaerolineaceae bacterium]|nr:glycosyltransferase family 2 protein [Anaerolineaceae bacterium]
MVENKPILPLPKVDLVVPVYNEENVIALFHAQLQAAIAGLPYHFKIYYINDGSLDHTQDCLEQIRLQDERVELVEFSRNFGHQSALTAGLDLAQGDYVITLDGDGQHPPQLIGEMLKLAESGYDVVLTQRLEQASLPPFKKKTSDLFYKMINRIGETQILPGSADFRLLAQPVVAALRSMHEYHRFLRGMVSWVGFRTVILPYQPGDRIAGQSKYSFSKMLRLAMDAIFSFSLVPLYLSISLGVLFLVLALAEAIYVLSFWVSGQTQRLAPGWSSLMFMLLVVGGILMISIGFIGIYIGYIFQEVKHRPVYLIRRMMPSRQSDETAHSPYPEAPGG